MKIDTKNFRVPPGKKFNPQQVADDCRSLFEVENVV